VVLVDTSVWVRFLAGREPYARELDRLLAHDEVFGHELVFGELLIGDRGGRAALLTAYSSIDWAGPVMPTEVVALVKAQKLNGRGIGWIDAQLLASALVADCRLWTADNALAGLATATGIAHDATRR
jgi:hypothetical protein